MILPSIHLNGTAAADLLAAYRDAHEALTRAITAVSEAAPHGRDYYPQGDDAIRVAGREHAKRLASLLVVRDEIEALAMHCIDRIPERVRA